MAAFFCLFFPRGASLTWPRRVEIFCTFKQFIWNYFDPFSTCLSSSSFSKSKLLLSLLASEVWTSSCKLGSHGEIRIHVWSAMVELPCCLVRYCMSGPNIDAIPHQSWDFPISVGITVRVPPSDGRACPASLFQVHCPPQCLGWKISQAAAHSVDFPHILGKPNCKGRNSNISDNLTWHNKT